MSTYYDVGGETEYIELPRTAPNTMNAEGYICNRAVTAYEVYTLAIHMEQIYADTIARRVDVLATRVEKERRRHAPTCSSTFENVQPPPNEGLTSLGRLVVLEQSARSVRILDRVRRGSKQSWRCIGLSLSSGASVTDAKRDLKRECGLERRGDAESYTGPHLRSSRRSGCTCRVALSLPSLMDSHLVRGHTIGVTRKDYWYDY